MNLVRLNVGDECLRTLSSSLETLKFNATTISHASLHALGELPLLKYLAIGKDYSSDIDEGPSVPFHLVSSIAFRTLRTLILTEHVIKSIEDLRSICSFKLLELNLNQAKGTVFKTAAHLLSNLTTLETLQLDSVKISQPAGIQAVAHLHQLKTLDLGNCHFQGRDFHSLTCLTALQELYLQNSMVPKDSFSTISHLTNLKVLDLTDCSNFGNCREKLFSVLPQLCRLFL